MQIRAGIAERRLKRRSRVGALASNPISKTLKSHDHRKRSRKKGNAKKRRRKRKLPKRQQSNDLALTAALLGNFDPPAPARRNAPRRRDRASRRAEYSSDEVDVADKPGISMSQLEHERDRMSRLAPQLDRLLGYPS